MFFSKDNHEVNYERVTANVVGAFSEVGGYVVLIQILIEFLIKDYQERKLYNSLGKRLFKVEQSNDVNNSKN